jgi:hypothetical protein
VQIRGLPGNRLCDVWSLFPAFLVLIVWEHRLWRLKRPLSREVVVIPAIAGAGSSLGTTAPTTNRRSLSLAVATAGSGWKENCLPEGKP